eukprot:8530451-Pyramimonas_sp.AAC.1
MPLASHGSLSCWLVGSQAPRPPPQVIPPGGSASTQLPVSTSGAVAPPPSSAALQIAIKNRQQPV